MKGSLIVIVFFCVGCIMGVFNKFQFNTHTVSMYILYALMLQVGISIGSNKNLKAIISHLHPKMLLIPLGTITGTLLFSALASILLSQWSVFDCMAVGSGFAYYSLSSILITQFKEPTIGIQLATELGTIALLTNIFANDGTSGYTAYQEVFRETCSHFGGRSQLNGCIITFHQQIFGKRNDSYRYFAWYSDRYQRACIRFFLL